MVRTKNFKNVSTTSKNLATKHMPYINYKEAKKLLNEPYISEVVEEKHLVFGWQHSSNIEPVIKNYVKNLIGRYIQR